MKNKLNVIARTRQYFVAGTKQSQIRRLLRQCFACCLAMTMRLPSAFACPLCKDAIVKMGEIWTAIGFNLSVYFMIAIPFLLVGSFVLVLYFNQRKHK